MGDPGLRARSEALTSSILEDMAELDPDDPAPEWLTDILAQAAEQGGVAARDTDRVRTLTVGELRTGLRFTLSEIARRDAPGVDRPPIGD